MRNDFSFDGDYTFGDPDTDGADDGRSELFSGNDTEYVVETKDVVKEGAKSIFSLVLWGVVGLIFIVGTLYALLAATLMYLAPSTADDASSFEKFHVARDTFTASQIPPGAVVYGSASSQVGNGFLDSMMEGFVGVTNPISMEVITGPSNVLDSKDGKLTIDGKPSSITSNMNRMVLDDQFLVKCVEGSCKPGQHFVISVEGISGQIVGKVDGLSYQTVTSSEDLTK